MHGFGMRTYKKVGTDPALIRAYGRYQQFCSCLKLDWLFQLVLLSAFSMHTWRNNLRGKVPVHQLQPVQVCSSLSQVAFVLRDPRRGCPEDSMDDALSLMDRLADML